MDDNKRCEWLLQQTYFSSENADLYAVSAWVLADGRINCHMSLESGVKDFNTVNFGGFEILKF